MSEGQAPVDALKEEAIPLAPEANRNEEQAAADGADDALDSVLEADDDAVDLAFIEEVGFLRHVMQPAQVT